MLIEFLQPRHSYVSPVSVTHIHFPLIIIVLEDFSTYPGTTWEEEVDRLHKPCLGDLIAFHFFPFLLLILSLPRQYFTVDPYVSKGQLQLCAIVYPLTPSDFTCFRTFPFRDPDAYSSTLP